ncbi:MAG TPA: response regulator [Flavisolibacter sp.]|nr:response regulator [Flavisolibacter sp.]
MSKKGPIVIIEDDLDDQSILEEVFGLLEVKNELLFFTNGLKALEHLKVAAEDPFIIISDVNLPGMSGPDLKREINKDPVLREKSIPFVFFTTTASNQAVKDAYEMMVQGYFQKGNSFAELTNALRLIVGYWTLCKHPIEN